MIADSQRNSAFERALRTAVRASLDRTGECHVLDIGSGSGLLAMMAARAGATRVTALEMVTKPLYYICIYCPVLAIL